MDTPASSATSRSPGGRRRREDAGVMPPSSHPPPSPTHSASRRGLLVRGGATSCLTALNGHDLVMSNVANRCRPLLADRSFADASSPPSTSAAERPELDALDPRPLPDRKSTRLNSSHVAISYAVFCLKKKKKTIK